MGVRVGLEVRARVRTKMRPPLWACMCVLSVDEGEAPDDDENQVECEAKLSVMDTREVTVTVRVMVYYVVFRLVC